MAPGYLTVDTPDRTPRKTPPAASGQVFREGPAQQPRRVLLSWLFWARSKSKVCQTFHPTQVVHLPISLLPIWSLRLGFCDYGDYIREYILYKYCMPITENQEKNRAEWEIIQYPQPRDNHC